MKDENKAILVTFEFILFIICFIASLLYVASEISKQYGTTAGFFALLLPLIAAIVFMVIVLVQQGKNNEEE